METEALVAFAVRRMDRVRLAMRDRSMLPLLHEPHVLEVVSAEGNLRTGRIAVFRRGGRLLAHRIVRIKGDTLVCAGDAQPGSVELVHRSEVCGVVDAVRSTASADAPRVDNLAFRLHGAVLAKTRLPRALVVNAHPALRPRIYPVLFEIVSAIVRNDSAALSRLIRAVDLERLAVVAQRHRCGPLLAEGMGMLPQDELARGLAQRLAASRWAAASRAAKLREQLTTVLGILNARQIAPVLLKGAARLWRQDADCRLHDSSDLDLLVAPDEIEAAREALCGAGYRESDADPGPEFYGHHHHARPLYPPGAGVAVELHRGLASATESTIPTSLADLERFLEDVSTPATRVRALNAVGTALHLILHGHHRPALRDVYLVARILQRMSDGERETLRTELAREQRTRVPQAALTALAATCAGIAWPTDERAERFSRWMMRREDLPRPLRAKPDCFDAWVAAEGQSISRALIAAWRAANFSAAKTSRERLKRLGRVLSFIFAGAVTALYAPFMRERSEVPGRQSVPRPS